MSNGVTEINGPFSYENWSAYVSGDPLIQTVEYPLFSDANIEGGIIDTHGPYYLINAVRMGNRYPTRPAIVLRVNYHLKFRPPQMDKTDTSRYHGGLLSDEIAALVSLCLGIRLKAGGESRIFGQEDDPMGLPISWGHISDPILPVVQEQLVLPRAVGSHHLRLAEILSTFHLLSAPAAIALVRAARLYQEAIWIVESTPELSWIRIAA